MKADLWQALTRFDASSFGRTAKSLLFKFLLVTPLSITAASSGAATAPTNRPPTQPRLEHIAIWAADIDRSAAFLEEVLGWRRHPLDFGVPDDSAVFGGMRLAFVDANGFWLELVQPTTEGPGMEFLKEKGDGAIIELDFFVDDFDKTMELLESKHIQPMGMDGNPMQNGGLLREWAIIDGKKRDADERIAYLPMDVSRGTSIELGWEYPSGVVYYRDDTWGPDVRTPTTTPRMDHVTVAATDLAATNKVYSEALDLHQVPSAPGLPREWMGVGASDQAWFYGNANVWVNVVAPQGATGEKTLARFGDGNIMEMAAEVMDIEAFYDEMQKKGITMTAGDDTPLPAGSKAVTTPSGDRYAYFPLDRSEGMRIMVFERAPGDASVITKRDKALSN